MKRPSPFLLFVLLLSFQVVQAQSLSKFYPEELREDVLYFQQSIEKFHPGADRYCTKKELDRQFDLALDRLHLPLTSEQFIDSVMPVIHCIADAHTTITLPEEENELLRSDVPLIPLSVQVVDDELYLRIELKGFRSIPAGSRIISINGERTSDIVRVLRSMLVADGENVTYKDHLIEAGFPIYYRRAIDQSSEFLVRYEDANGEDHDQTIFALTAAEIKRSGFSLNLNEPIGPIWYFSYHEEVATGWLTLRTLDPNRIEDAGIKPSRFLEGVVDEMLKREAKVFVIDLRGADGKQLRMAEWLYGAFAEVPFKAVNDIRAKQMDMMTASMVMKDADDHIIDLLARMVEQEEGGSALASNDLLLEKLDPYDKRFEGKVYIVQDGGTIESAAVLGMMAVRDGRAKLVGREAGTNAVSFCGGHQLVMKGPRSGVELRIPILQYVLDSPEPIGDTHGMEPERPARPTPQGAPQGKDTLKDALLQLITEMQW